MLRCAKVWFILQENQMVLSNTLQFFLVWMDQILQEVWLKFRQHSWKTLHCSRMSSTPYLMLRYILCTIYMCSSWLRNLHYSISIRYRWTMCLNYDFCYLFFHFQVKSFIQWVKIDFLISIPTSNPLMFSSLSSLYMFYRQQHGMMITTDLELGWKI